MAHPKHKISKQRKRKRRTHDKLEVFSLSECPRCNHKKKPHRICGNCGYYKDSYVVKI